MVKWDCRGNMKFAALSLNFAIYLLQFTLQLSIPALTVSPCRQTAPRYQKGRILFPFDDTNNVSKNGPPTFLAIERRPNPV